VRRGNQTAIAGDGQVTVENHVVKNTARKLRRLAATKSSPVSRAAPPTPSRSSRSSNRSSTRISGNLRRAAIELAKDWRTDRVLRRLEALMIVADGKDMFLISGNGDVLEPDEGVAAIGSGGTFAQSAATALLRHTEMNARDIAENALRIAASICIYTNDSITVEMVEA
jgi:ATP-dependent HslUV protease subunit HslV